MASNKISSCHASSLSASARKWNNPTRVHLVTLPHYQIHYENETIQQEFTLSCFLIIRFSMKMKHSNKSSPCHASSLSDSLWKWNEWKWFLFVCVCVCACVHVLVCLCMCVYLVDTVRKSKTFWIFVSLVWSISGHFINYTTTSPKTYVLFKTKHNVTSPPPPPELVTSKKVVMLVHSL